MYLITKNPIIKDLNPVKGSGWCVFLGAQFVTVLIFFILKFITFMRDQMYGRIAPSRRGKNKRLKKKRHHLLFVEKNIQDTQLRYSQIADVEKNIPVIIGKGDDQDLQESAHSDQLQDYQTSELGSSQLDNIFHSNSDSDQ
eukprot:Anaeramoba_flamelloidesa92975_12.p1 GENE.a92975_12~~a92975_12.p1  ORF type:complete len:156 (-),score=21.81 a92975_12:97-519(-)